MRLNSIVIILSFLTLIVCFWNRNAIPEPATLHPAALAPPVQSPTDEQSFVTRWQGIDYRIDPEFDYELVGQVVSYRHHDGSSRMHRRSGDHLNMLDLCVIWGDNLRHPDINALEFWNGIFTCNASTRDREAWAAFDLYQLSNNHLISDDPNLRDAVLDVDVGDQIRVRGWLASYTGPVGTRGTSSTRNDTGDGACETIYVTTFEILDQSRSPWRAGLYGSLFVLVGSAFLHFRWPYRPYRARS